MCKKLVQMVPQTDFGKEVQNSQEGFQLHSLFVLTLPALMLPTLEN